MAGGWTATRDFLAGVSRSRGRQGFSPSETAMFVFSVKEPVFAHLRAALEGVIRRQGEEMLELSTPVIQLWDGILALPIIGTLDSSRTQIVMEALLQQVVATRSPLAITDS